MQTKGENISFVTLVALDSLYRYIESCTSDLHGIIMIILIILIKFVHIYSRRCHGGSSGAEDGLAFILLMVYVAEWTQLMSTWVLEPVIFRL